MVIKGEEKIDSVYFDKLYSIFEMEPTLAVALRPINYGGQKLRFLHQGENPKFRYRLFPRRIFDYGNKTLNDIKKDLKREKNQPLKKIYEDKIEELEHHLKLRQSIGNDSRAFYQQSVWLFSRPDSKNNKQALRDFREELELKKIKKNKRKKYNANIIKKAFNRAIRILKISDWRAVLENTPADIITLNPKHRRGKKIEIPRERRADIYEIEGLVNHEIGTHLVRGLNGVVSPLKLLSSMGADKYLATEEGLATFSEQRLAIERGMIPKKAGVKATLAISAAMDGRNFKDTYDYLLGLGFSHRDAWKYTFRTFRGISNTSSRKGFILTFDWRYRQGNQMIWYLVNERGENILNRLWVGKIGVQHLSLMKQLGITKPNIQRKYLHIEELLPEM